MKLLLINGNRTAAVTETVLAEAQNVAAPGTELKAVTASFGADIVFSHAGNVLAAHAVLDALARHHAGFDAVILAISFDSGLAAARELVAKPVLGITESGIRAARTAGQRIGVLTFGNLSSGLYHDVFTRYGVTPQLAAIRTIDIASSAEYLAAEKLDARIAHEANLLAAEGAAAVVICGAAMAGVARRLRDAVRVPLIDGVASAIAEAETLVRARTVNPSAAATTQSPSSVPTRVSGVGPELAALFNRD